MDISVMSNLLDTGIVYFCRQRPIASDNGGYRRTAQLASILVDVDLGVVSALDYAEMFNNSAESQFFAKLNSINGNLGSKIQAKYRCMMTRGKYFRWSDKMRDYYYFLTWIAKWWRHTLRIKGNKIRLAIVDDPIYFEPLVDFFVDLNIPVVAHCHNVETLSKSQIIGSSQLAYLKDELALLEKCSLVITISCEESFLLRNIGIVNMFLPYFPDVITESRMYSIRNRRQCSNKHDYLLLGTVLNPPTLNGMKSIIQWWHKTGPRNDRLLVAGYNTEQFRYELDISDEIVFCGAVSDVELDDILTNCKATIVYQDTGSGALTKLCEYLLAGVPVLANSHAARSYHNLSGVVEFNSLEDLEGLLAKDSVSLIDVISPPRPDSSALKRALLGLIK